MTELAADQAARSEESEMSSRSLLSRYGGQFAEAIILIILITIVTGSLSEYSARRSYIQDIEAQISKLDKNYAAYAASGQTAPSSSDDGYYAIRALTPQSYMEKSEKLERRLESIRGQERSGISINELKSEYTRERSRFAVMTEDLNSRGTRSTEAGISWPMLVLIYFSPAGFSSDVLLAMLAICCGGVGSLIAGLRNKEFTAIRDVILGLSTGFVVYLVLRGGKYVFLLQQTDVALNPYGFALAALLSGLFSDRAYNLLSTVIEMFEKKIKEAMK